MPFILTANQYQIVYAKKISNNPNLYNILIEDSEINKLGAYIIDEDAILYSRIEIIKNFKQLPLEMAQETFNLNEKNYGFTLN